MIGASVAVSMDTDRISNSLEKTFATLKLLYQLVPKINESILHSNIGIYVPYVINYYTFQTTFFLRNFDIRGSKANVI